MIIELHVFDIIYRYSLYREFSVFAVINILILLFWIMSLISFYKFGKTLHQEIVNCQSDTLQMEESLKLVRTLQSQRHDYRNQLQVIRVLAQFNKNSEMIKYIDEYISAADYSASLSSRIGNSAISAVFLVYEAEAKDKGITFTIDSDIDFSHFYYSPTKITRILGNIIRNSIEILEQLNVVKREIQVTLWETTDQFHISIWNNGPEIPQQLRNQIFLPGFSTKQSSGLGLAIVKDLVHELNGEIFVSSAREVGTEFKLSFPSKHND
jgi:sensor histidine kinase regulating citrate/malate metabolism